MQKMKMIKRGAASVAIALLLLPLTGTAYAAKGDQGVDWSKYQGNNGKWGSDNDKFSISQIGDTTMEPSLINQLTALK